MYMLNTANKFSESFDTFGEALEYGLTNSLFGILVVFGALILIWGILSLFKVFFYTIPNSKKAPQKKQENKTPAPAKAVNVPAAPAIAPAPEASTLSVAVQEHSVVAAIVSAISAFRTANGENGTFRVVSFKKRK